MTLNQHFDALFEQIKHGDEEHQKWLYDKIQEYAKSCQSNPVEPVEEEEWLGKWQKVRTDAISEMFDNVDEYGIYPTTKLFNTVDEWLLNNPITPKETVEGEVYGYKQVIEDYKEVIADHNRLVRELDIALNGDNAAKQASLCDIISQIRGIGEVYKWVKATDELPEKNKAIFVMYKGRKCIMQYSDDWYNTKEGKQISLFVGEGNRLEEKEFSKIEWLKQIKPQL